MKMLLNVADLSLRRAGRTLLAGLNVELGPGEIAVVLGPNGAGKSSLLLALAGLMPVAGSIAVDGIDISAMTMRERMRAVAWLGDLPPTEFGLSVMQRLQLVGEVALAQIEAAAATMDIAALLDRPLGALSSGERQRVELAALSLRDAPLWLLDEPTAHLDLKHQLSCIEMLKAERGKGRAIVVVLHDLQQAQAVADRLILIDGRGGAIFGAADALFETERLSALFDAPIRENGGLLMPDYGVDR